MKHLNKYILSAFISTALLSSCTFEVLDDNPYYMGDSADQIFSSKAKIEAASVGMYDALQNAEFLGGRAQIYVDARGIDVNPPTYFGGLSNFNATSSNATVENAWQGAYRTIAECNLFLEGIQGAVDNKIIDDTEFKKFAAEARFIRAVAYFYTLNFWGQMYVKDSENLGIPLIINSYDGKTGFTEAIKVSRSSINDCYQLIIDDLTYAKDNANENWGADYSNRARTTVNAAKAMLSRVYLYRGDNANAIVYADQLLGKYSLDSDVVNVFTTPETSPEIIFFVAMNQTDNPNTNNSLGQHYGASARADITVSTQYLNLLSATDTRKTEGLIENGGAFYCNKYRKKSADWAPIIRYAEVLLNKAEALVKKNNTVDPVAVTLLSEVHSRSEAGKTFAVADFANAKALLDEILLERRRELAFEGHASFDLFRNEIGIPAGRGSASAPAITYPNNLFALPIPSSDVEKSKGALVQNKGY